MGKDKKVYLINNASDIKYSICKVLNEYDNKEKAIDDLKKLLSEEISESDLLKLFKNKQG